MQIFEAFENAFVTVMTRKHPENTLRLFHISFHAIGDALNKEAIHFKNKLNRRFY